MKKSVTGDPLVTALRKAYCKSATKKIEDLLAERSRWSRKQTIARNKLAWVEKRIEEAALELARQADGVQPGEKKS